MKEFPDHYAALGIRQSADQEVIAAAYRALVKKYHPDTAQGDDPTAGERFRAVKAAHDVLGNAERRRAYDAERAARGLDRYDEAFAAGMAINGGGAGTPPGGGAQALPGRNGHRSTRPAETVLRAVRDDVYPDEDRGSLFRFAVVAVLVCFIGAGVLMVLWPSIAGSPGRQTGAVEALNPPPPPVSQPELQSAVPAPQNVTETAKSDAPDGGDALQAAIPQGGAEDSPPPAKPKLLPPKPVPPKPAAQKPSIQKPAAPKPVVQTPQPDPLEQQAASLYALSMREESNGVTTMLADGTLTFNTRRACEDFAREARDRRLDAAIIETGEEPEISWECKGR
jgi:curved DNA-binding protein CbpA